MAPYTAFNSPRFNPSHRVGPDPRPDHLRTYEMTRVGDLRAFSPYDAERGLLAIRCRLCGAISPLLADIESRYCANCRKFHDDQPPYDPLSHAAT